MSYQDLACSGAMSNFLPLFHPVHRRFIQVLLWYSVLVTCLVAVVFLTATVAHAQSGPGALLEQARMDEKDGDYAAAERIYEQALAVEPESPETHKRFGVLQQTELKFEESISHFKRALARDPQYPEANFFLGASYLGENDFAQAISSFKQELTTPKPHPRCRYYLALALHSLGRVDEAIAQFQLAVADNPKNADALYQLARIYKNASVQAIDRLKALDQDSFQLHALMGEVHADEERYAEAVKEYQAALAKRPDAPGIHFAIGVAYWVQHELGEAKKEFLEALQENPNDALTNLYLGDIGVHEARFAEALTYLQLASKGQPNMAQLHTLMGKCYRGMAQSQQAKVEFLAAIEADPTAAQPHYLLAQVYRDLHNQGASEAELAQFENLSKQEKERNPEKGSQN